MSIHIDLSMFGAQKQLGIDEAGLNGPPLELDHKPGTNVTFHVPAGTDKNDFAPVIVLEFNPTSAPIGKLYHLVTAFTADNPHSGAHFPYAQAYVESAYASVTNMISIDWNLDKIQVPVKAYIGYYETSAATNLEKGLIIQDYKNYTYPVIIELGKDVTIGLSVTNSQEKGHGMFLATLDFDPAVNKLIFNPLYRGFLIESFSPQLLLASAGFSEALL